METNITEKVTRPIVDSVVFVPKEKGFRDQTDGAGVAGGGGWGPDSIRNTP